MKTSLLSLLLSLCAGTAALAENRAMRQGEAENKSDSFVFQLLPNSVSKNPRLEMSFVTEMTDTGRKLTPPTAAKPTYYLAQPGGYRQMGDGAAAGEPVPPPADMQKLMHEALSRAGFQPADALHPATIVIIFHWGSYSTPTEIPGEETVSVAIKNHQLLERAALVGGEKFSRELENAIVEASSLAAGAPTTRTNFETGQVVADSAFGDAAGYFSDVFNPISLFLGKSAKNRMLFDLAAGSCYYVIASAYDAEAVARKQRILLWRTKMSVAAEGVSLPDTVQPMILRSARYLGRETDGAVNISRHLHEGKVELGDLKVMGEAEKTAPSEPKK